MGAEFSESGTPVLVALAQKLFEGRPPESPKLSYMGLDGELRRGWQRGGRDERAPVPPHRHGRMDRWTVEERCKAVLLLDV